MTILKPGGRAAVVVPDNCLFADQAGDVFKVLTEDCELDTVLRLPNGTFSPYSPGTKTNVIFFTKGYPTENVWIYDGRTNVPRITKKDRPLTPEHFAEFEACLVQTLTVAANEMLQLPKKTAGVPSTSLRSRGGTSRSIVSSGSKTNPSTTGRHCRSPKNWRRTLLLSWRQPLRS
jgi:hypothetical protein